MIPPPDGRPPSPPPWLPEWARSIRFRLTALYSLVVFGLAGALLLGLNYGLWANLHTMRASERMRLARFVPVGVPAAGGGRRVDELFLANAEAFERLVNLQTLATLRAYSLWALAVLSVLSLGTGWVLSGRALRPIERIRQVARRITATDLTQRIDLDGPDDELRRLAETFDDMLERLELAWAAQQRFLADASHELRNPLATIRTNLDVALADPGADVEELRHAAVVAERATRRMTHLVDDLLALTRGQQPTAAADLVGLDDVADEVVEEFTATARARGVTLERARGPAGGGDGAGDGPAVLADRDALRRAVANLVDNAVRHTPAGARVRVVTTAVDDRASVAVADEGPGVPAVDRARVFDRFYRVDGGRARGDGGSGLGLAIVRQIAEAHGGTVRLDSTEGAGATFAIDLPRATVAEEVRRR